MTMKPCSGQSGPRGGRDAKYPLQHTLAQVSCARWRCTVTGTPLACTSTERSAPGAVHAVRARDTAKEERRRPRGRAAAAGVRLGCLPPPERRERAAAAARSRRSGGGRHPRRTPAAAALPRGRRRSSLAVSRARTACTAPGALRSVLVHARGVPVTVHRQRAHDTCARVCCNGYLASRPPLGPDCPLQGFIVIAGR